MRKLKFRIVNSSGALVAAFAVMFACAPGAYAEDPEISSTPRTMFLDASGDIAEWWICESYSSGIQTCINTHRADIRLTDEVEHPFDGVTDISTSTPQSSSSASNLSTLPRAQRP